MRAVAVKPGDFHGQKGNVAVQGLLERAPSDKAQDVGTRAEDITASSEGADNINYKAGRHVLMSSCTRLGCCCGLDQA